MWRSRSRIANRPNPPAVVGSERSTEAPVAGAAERDPSVAGPGVLDDVQEDLPDDAKEEDLLIFGQGRGSGIAHEVEPHSALLLQPLAEVAERCLEPQPVEGRAAQLEGQRPGLPVK